MGISLSMMVAMSPYMGVTLFPYEGVLCPLHGGDHVPIRRDGSITTHSDSNVTIGGGGSVPHMAMSLCTTVSYTVVRTVCSFSDG